MRADDGRWHRVTVPELDELDEPSDSGPTPTSPLVPQEPRQRAGAGRRFTASDLT